MKLPSNLGSIFLAVYLILIAISTLIPGVAIPSIVFGILALLAGIFIIIGR